MSLHHRNGNQKHNEISPYTCQRVAIISKWKITSIGEDVEKREPSCTVSETENWCRHYGKEHGVSSNKLKVELYFDQVIPVLGIYPKKPEILIQKIYMYLYVHCSIIYNSQDLEAAQVPMNRWMNEKALVHLHNWNCVKFIIKIRSHYQCLYIIPVIYTIAQICINVNI